MDAETVKTLLASAVFLIVGLTADYADYRGMKIDDVFRISFDSPDVSHDAEIADPTFTFTDRADRTAGSFTDGRYSLQPTEVMVSRKAFNQR